MKNTKILAKRTTHREVQETAVYAEMPSTLTGGGSRAHTSMASTSGNKPSTTSKDGSRAAAIESWRATDKRLHQRRRKAACIERRRIGGSDDALKCARSRRSFTISELQRPPVLAARTRNTQRSLATRSLYVRNLFRRAAAKAASWSDEQPG